MKRYTTNMLNGYEEYKVEVARKAEGIMNESTSYRIGEGVGKAVRHIAANGKALLSAAGRVFASKKNWARLGATK